MVKSWIGEYYIRVFASLRHAIKGQTNDRRPLWFYLICSTLESVVSRVNVWKPSLLPTRARHQAIYYIDTASLFNSSMWAN